VHVDAVVGGVAVFFDCSIFCEILIFFSFF